MSYARSYTPAEVIFEPDVMLPSQIADPRALSPELRLWWKVLQEAITAALGNAGRARDEAREWIETPWDVLGGFDWVCAMLGLDAGWMRGRFARLPRRSLTPGVRVDQARVPLAVVRGAIEKALAAYQDGETFKTSEMAKVATLGAYPPYVPIALRQLVRRGRIRVAQEGRRGYGTGTVYAVVDGGVGKDAETQIRLGRAVERSTTQGQAACPDPSLRAEPPEDCRALRR